MVVAQVLGVIAMDWGGVKKSGNFSKGVFPNPLQSQPTPYVTAINTSPTNYSPFHANF